MASFATVVFSLLAVAEVHQAVSYPSTPSWINCTRGRCHCEKSADCYDNGPGVCMRLLLGGTNCRYCPLGFGVLYHLPEETLPEGLSYAKVCHPMKLCEDTRCFDTIQCQEPHPMGISMRTRQQSRCICERGFKPERLAPGVERCVDIDECALANRSVLPKTPPGSSLMMPPQPAGSHGNYCPPKSKCVNTVGAFQCRCLDGFRERYEDGLKCDDVNECEQLGFGACPWYQACINEPGNFRCANPFYEWISNEVFLLIAAIIVLLILNILMCWMCRSVRRCLGYEDRLPVRQRQKHLDNYSVVRF